MAKAASCPRCKASSETITLIFGRTSYCVNCGWNCEAAKVEIRTELLSIGLRRLRLRRLRFVREQFFLAAVAQNIKRLVRFPSQPITPTMEAAS